MNSLSQARHEDNVDADPVTAVQALVEVGDGTGLQESSSAQGCLMLEWSNRYSRLVCAQVLMTARVQPPFVESFAS